MDKEPSPTLQEATDDSALPLRPAIAAATNNTFKKKYDLTR